MKWLGILFSLLGIALRFFLGGPDRAKKKYLEFKSDLAKDREIRRRAALLVGNGSIYRMRKKNRLR